MQSERVAETPVERFKLHSVSELLHLPEPKWLIDGVITEGALAGLYGPSGDGKSFLTLDWALCVATGTDWCGRPVRRGAVVYVAAEGGRSIRKRVQAWMQTHGFKDLPGAFFLLESVQVRSEEDLMLLAGKIQARSIEPTLIVLDTLARCFVGGDENSSKEVGEFVEGVAWLHAQTQAAVLVVHHTGKQATAIERGSSALRGAADVMIYISKCGSVVTIKNNKQKDAEEFEAVKLQLQQVTIGSGSDATSSCVLVPNRTATNLTAALSPYLRRTLEALALCPEGTATTADWAARASRKERTLHSHRKKLVADGYVTSLEGKGRYAITQAGRSVLGTAATASPLQLAVGNRVPSNAAATATTPEEWQ